MNTTNGPPLPPGWTGATDPQTGHVYFANPHTGAASWERPVKHPPPPPPPPPSLPPPPPPTLHVQPSVFDVKAQNYQSQQMNNNIPQPIRCQQQPQQQQQQNNNNNMDLESELRSLSVGQIADLCAARQEAHLANNSHDETIPLEPYLPVNTGALVLMRRPPIEAGRLDIRVHTLHDKLRKIIISPM